ncbi:MAG TPA: proton-conducting transporter membrane subunit [Patescibacteria group bacterium]|nr:proton-conducting transporter membrane subunit [Patescibacteria group bacterium]
MLLAIIVSSFLIAAAGSALIRVRRVMEILSLSASVVALAAASVIAYKVGTHGTYSPVTFFSIDSMGAVITLIVATVACFASMYSIPYFRKESAKNIIGLRRIQQYNVLVNVFLAACFLAATASNPVAAWIFLEITTLSTVFLISYYNRAVTIEAAWKYLIINAIGLLLAFFGTLLFMSTTGHGVEGFVTWQNLKTSVMHIDPSIVKIAFIFILIGYGTKIGLAPMHTWKPDAYSKSPAPLGALLSGALMPVAFLIMLRFKVVTDVAVGMSYSRSLLIAFGLMSVIVAALSILTVKNYKRMLAYSSIEHAGLMALGFGFGGLGAFAALMLMIYHSLVKSSLFFASGNLLIQYHSERIQKIKGAMSVLPATATLLLIGMFAATGLPPFGIFLTELSIMSAGLQGRHLAIAAIAMIALAVVFIGFFRQVSAMVLSEKPAEKVKPIGDSFWLIAPPVALLTITLVISFYMPSFMQTLIHQAVTGL